MDNNKQIELIRKRNIELNQQIDEMKKRLKEQSEQGIAINSYTSANDLITDLERIKQEWLDSIRRLKECEEEYVSLINELKDVKKMMKDIGFKIPLYRKFLAIIKRK